MAPAKMIYNEGNTVSIPNLDLLTLLFDSEHCRAQEDTPLHASASDPDKYITKSQARVLTEQFAHFLRTTYAIGASGPGVDVVMAISSGQPVLPCFFFGVLAAEGVYSAASPTSTVGEVVRQIRDGPVRVVVCSEDAKGLGVEAARAAGLAERNVLVLSSRPFKLQSANGEVVCDFEGRLTWRRITDAEELRRSKICILYSSGTTGLPKGVLVSHANIVSEAYLLASGTRPHRDSEALLGRPWTQRTLGHLPTAHIAGIQLYFVNLFFDAGTVYWMPRFAFDDFLRHCAALRITTFFSVPPIWAAIAKHPAVTDQLRFVRLASSGAAPLTGDLQRVARGKMGDEGASLSQVWGLSETTGSATLCRLDREIVMGSLGSLLPNVVMRLVDDDENDVPPGEPGEALIKGPIVTQGYHNNPEANRTSFTPDGFFRTGDILRIQDDELFLVDRKKELIKYKGLQIAPAELEGLLVSHPSILDAAVIGIAQDGNEVPRAYVVLALAAVGKLSEEELVDYVRTKVSGHKRLRGGVRFVESVPRSLSGKILRKDVREMRRQEERELKL